MSLTIMTFNLRYASDQPPNAWPQRRPAVDACLTEAEADIVGTQEGLAGQIGDIADDHPEYDRLGLGRDADGGGETATIFHRRDRFAVAEHGHFWLSDTPEVPGSRTWGNSLPRMATWVLLQDREDGQDWYVLNTHLDHEVSRARVRGAELICERAAAWDQRVPVIITGDFNAVSRAEPTYDIFVTAGFTDSRFAAQQTDGPTYDSFHGYEEPRTAGDHIDWILSRGPVEVETFALLDVRVDGQCPSDHFPLLARLSLRG